MGPSKFASRARRARGIYPGPCPRVDGGRLTSPAKGEVETRTPAHAPQRFALTIEADNEADLDAILNIASRMSGVRVTVAKPEDA